ncbi:TonB-dependent hemoglobin/transferrin/lactoferrin family receptor [Vibrio intestinalis]|uniref:TonB-dependent hemoglobin/transferrin/lactoferrin family receptor n=1 Tax=Vibrio intestinalis TaxID=2933291 RepID=UPI0021A773E1|nr:TonB-dependent hemoglobin/transferrin/lactoferrin family receptor [Vibrio intestinalis]
MHKKSVLSMSILLALSTQVMAEEIFTMETVTVTATRVEQKVDEIAATVNVVSAKDIEQNMMDDISKVFDYTPGVDFNADKTGRADSQDINIRGVEGDRVNIIIDGVTAPSRYGDGPEFVSSSRVAIDPEMLKAVEVVKGASSTLYGSEGMGGAVIFVTKDPKDFLAEGDDSGGLVKTQYSSSDESFKETVVLANRTGDLESMITYTRRDGHELNNFVEESDRIEADYQQDNVLAKLQYQVNENHRVEFTGEYVDNSLETDSLNAHRATDGSREYHYYDTDDNTRRDRLSFKHIYDGNLLITDSISSQFNWLNQERNSITDRHKLGKDANFKHYIYSEDTLQAEIQLDKSFYLGETEHYLIYGLAAKQSSFENQNNNFDGGVADPKLYQPDAKDTSFGIFAQDEIALLDGQLLLSPGVRYDSYQSSPDTLTRSDGSVDTYDDFSGDAFTAKLGALYQITSELSTYAQVSQGYRAPTFVELYYAFEERPMSMFEIINVANDDLEAETSINYEWGFKHNTAATATQFNVFYSEYDNFISQELVNSTYDDNGTRNPIDDVTSLFYSYVNIEEATIKGIELSNTVNFGALNPSFNGFRSNLAATYTEGEDGQGEELVSINPWNLVAGLSFDTPQGNWGTSIKVKYVADKTSDRVLEQGGIQVDTPSYTVADLTMYYKPMKDLTLRAGVFNLTDEQYWNWHNVRGQDTLEGSTTQPERNYSLSVAYEF